MNGYKIVDQQKIDQHIIFIRIEPSDIALTLKDVFTSLANLAWINSFDKDYVRESFETRASKTIKYISENIIRSTDDFVTSSSGEYIVSELARKTIVDQMNYLDIPLAELIKDKAIGNHGFDFYTTNHDLTILFGEAKYNATQNAYGRSFEQIVRFEEEKQDKSDLIDIDKFCCETSKQNFSKGQKGFIAAFAAKKTNTQVLIEGIQNNENYKRLTRFSEIVCVAVNV